MDCIRNVGCIKSVNAEMTTDIVEWMKTTCCAEIGIFQNKFKN